MYTSELSNGGGRFSMFGLAKEGITDKNEEPHLALIRFTAAKCTFTYEVTWLLDY